MRPTIVAASALLLAACTQSATTVSGTSFYAPEDRTFTFNFRNAPAGTKCRVTGAKGAIHGNGTTRVRLIGQPAAATILCRFPSGKTLPVKVNRWVFTRPNYGRLGAGDIQSAKVSLTYPKHMGKLTVKAKPRGFSRELYYGFYDGRKPLAVCKRGEDCVAKALRIKGGG